jgi:hypothetical protein
VVGWSNFVDKNDQNMNKVQFLGNECS